MGILTDQDWIMINEVISKINQVHDNRRMRHFFLDIIKPLIPYDLAIFDLSKVKEGSFSNLYDPVVISCFTPDFEKDFIKDYDDYFYKLSYTRWIHFQTESVVYNESHVIDENVRKNSQYYKEYLSKYNLVHCCGCNIVKDDQNFGALTFYRKEESLDFTEREMFIFKQLHPHLINKLSQNYDIEEEKDIRIIMVESYSITQRELEIIELVYLGLGNKAISEKLFISENTVKKHLSNIFSKLEVKTRSKLIHYLNENDYNE